MGIWRDYYPELPLIDDPYHIYDKRCVIPSKEEAIKWFEKRYTIKGKKIFENNSDVWYATREDFKNSIAPAYIASGKRLISAGNFLVKHFKNRFK
jgi:hypothetical protein